MDFNSVIGIVIAVLAIFGGHALEGGHAGSLKQFTAFAVVLGGTLIFLLIARDWRRELASSSNAA